MKKILAGLLMLAAAPAAIAATYSGVGYTFTWDNAAGLTFDGSTFTKNYGITGASNQGDYSNLIDLFRITLSVQDGYYVEAFTTSIYGSFSTVLLESHAASQTAIYLQQDKFYQGIGYDGSSNIKWNYFNTSPTWPYIREPVDGEFVSTVDHGGGFNIPTYYDFTLITYHSAQNAIVSYELDKLEIYYRVVAVPEPSSYAMLGLGLGVLGFAASRKRKTLS